MRLICGVVHLDGAPAGDETLARMVNALTSPGLTPRVTLRVEGPAALGVLDFSSSQRAGDLPQALDGTWLAADLRLDRPRELAETLDLPPGPCPESLALSALAKWGKDLPDRMDGDFALAAWNPRQSLLLCARDIMGARPLCYAHRPGRLFAFASLPRGLHASGVVPRRLDVVALGRLQVEIYPRDHLTGFEEILWLPAGHSLVVTPDGARLHRAWRPDPAQVGSWRGSAAEASEILRHLVEESIACRLPPSGPVAAHLSGGLDSSAIAVVAARRLRVGNRRLHAFSQLARPSLFPVRDEREYIEAVLAQEPDIAWSPVYLPSLDEEGLIDPDLALAGPVLEPDDRICAAAASAGVELLLSGAGGDEGATYNGSGLYAAMLRHGRWRSLPAELRARARREKRSLVRVAAVRVVLPLLPDWLTSALAPMRRSPGQSVPGIRRRNAASFLSPSLANKVAAALHPETDWSNRATDRIQMLTESYVAVRADRWSIIGARHGIAFSFPLADRRILDFVLSLPIERFADRGFNRQPYRNAMAGVLPESIRWRDSKFVPFPDMPANLANASAGLLTKLERLRRCAEASRISDMFDMDAIAAALSAASRHAADEGLSLGPVGQAPVPEWFRMANHARNAFTLAEYVARHSA
jgi:asparagine synthase (glutamine-hydrolysing)